MNKEINNNRIISSNKEVIRLFVTNDCDYNNENTKDYEL